MWNIFEHALRFFMATHKGWQRFLSVRVSMWSESHKICKVWTHIIQVLTRYFPSYRVWLANPIIKSVWISESVDINQSIWMNQFCPIEASDLIVTQYLQLTWEVFVIRSKKGEVCAVALESCWWQFNNLKAICNNLKAFVSTFK